MEELVDLCDQSKKQTKILVYVYIHVEYSVYACVCQNTREWKTSLINMTELNLHRNYI